MVRRSRDDDQTPAMTLTPKQAIFVAEYTKDFNGTRAAIQAGYGKRSARITAAETLTKPNVQAATRLACARVSCDLTSHSITRSRNAGAWRTCGWAMTLKTKAASCDRSRNGRRSTRKRPYSF